MLFQRSCPGCGAGLGLGIGVGIGIGIGIGIGVGIGAGRSIICPACSRALGAARPVEVEAPPGIDLLIAAHRYDGVARRLVLAAKNGGRRSLLRGWGSELAGLTIGLERFDVVTWVPASRHGVRSRGYDQGRVLGRSAAAAIDAPARRLLVRRPGPDRVGSGRAERLSGPVLRCPLHCPPTVLLIDDVVTTGASIAAAAGALRAAGAVRVVGLVVAVAGDAPAIRAFDPDDRLAGQHYG